MPRLNSIDWFEIGTDNPAAAEQFYHDIFGWTVAHDDAASTDPNYQIFTTGDPAGVHGGLFATQGKLPGYAVFGILVEDVAATCQRVEEVGGKVQRAPVTNPAGVTFAHLLDPSGNQFEVFTLPSGQS
jgi:uncharacterized protein